MNRKMLLALAVALLLAAAPISVLARGGGEIASVNSTTGGPAMAVQVPSSREEAMYSFRDIAKKVLPVVVEIDVKEVVTQTAIRSPFDFFNNPPGSGQGRQFERQGLGSGIIVRKTGNTVYVLTNNHVVESATELSVKLDDQRTFTAKVVGTDPRKDLALVSFETKEAVPVAELGDSGQLEVGDLVLAVGNPLGFENTVTMGIVSALGRTNPNEQSFTDYIQTDASINQGNSGGALVNINGEVVGVNTWIAAPTGGNVGLGFAIPINNAKQAIDDIISKGKVEYGWLGVQIGDIQDGTANPLYAGFAKDLKVEGVKGALVMNAYKGSPADRAGLQPGDYVVRVSGVDIRSADHLTQVVGGLVSGKSYDIELIRFGERLKLSAKIGARDEKDTVAQYKNLWPGMTVVRLTDQIRKEGGIAAGIDGLVVGFVADEATPAAVAGFKSGDVITAINGKQVRSMLEYYKAIADKSKKDVSFTVNRKGTEVTIGISR